MNPHCIPINEAISIPFPILFENLTLLQNDTYAGNFRNEQRITFSTDYLGMNFTLSISTILSGNRTFQIHLSNTSEYTIDSNYVVFEFLFDDIPFSPYYLGWNTTFTGPSPPIFYSLDQVLSEYVQGNIYQFPNYNMTYISLVDITYINAYPFILGPTQLAFFQSLQIENVSSVYYWVNTFELLILLNTDFFKNAFSVQKDSPSGVATTSNIITPIISNSNSPKNNGLIIGLTVGLIGGSLLILALVLVFVFLFKYSRRPGYRFVMKRQASQIKLTSFSDVLVQDISLVRKLGEGNFRYPFFLKFLLEIFFL